jgi:hypothetical protein
MGAGDRRVGLKTGRGGPCFLVSLRSGSAVGFAFAWPIRRRSRGRWRVSSRGSWPPTSSGMAFERVEWGSLKVREKWEIGAFLLSSIGTLDTPRHS